MNLVIWVTLPLCYFNYRLFLSWIGRGRRVRCFCLGISEGSCINQFQKVGGPQLFSQKNCKLPPWLPYITLCYIDSRFFLPLEQSRTALLGWSLAASGLREAARWQLFSHKVLVHWKLKLLNFLVDFVLMLYTVLIIDWVLLLKIFRES